VRKINFIRNSNSGNLPMSKLSMALFNSMTGQPKEKLFEMPTLIEQISQEVDMGNSQQLDMNNSLKFDNSPRSKIGMEYSTKGQLDEILITQSEKKAKEEISMKLTKLQSFKMNTYSKMKSIDSSHSFDSFIYNIELLESLNDWEYSILPINDSSKKFNLIWTMFHSLGFLEKFEINNNVFGRFLSFIQEKYDYRNNPFHNFNHGFTGIIVFFLYVFQDLYNIVCHAIYIIIYKKLLTNYLDQMELFSLLLSGLCHDVDHTGRTNVFEIVSHSRLAIKYNDESVRFN